MSHIRNIYPFHHDELPMEGDEEHALTELDCQRIDRVSMPVDITDADEFPEIAKALEWAAKLSPERRKELGE